MDGVLGEVKLAALPCSLAEDRPARGPHASASIGEDVFNPMQAAGLEAQKGRRANAVWPPASARRGRTGPLSMIRFAWDRQGFHADGRPPA